MHNNRYVAANADIKPSRASGVLAGLAIAVALCALAAAGCAGGRGGETLVFAAASLTDVLTRLGKEFEDETGEMVTFSFGGSQHLARQIVSGAPADILIPAGPQPVELLENSDKIAGAAIDLLGNELVVVAREGSRLELRDLRDLPSLSSASISIPDPALAPAGRYAREVLTRLGLWESLASVIVPTADVRAALTNVERGNTDLAFVYRTDAASGEGLIILDVVPPGLHPPITYPLVMIDGSRASAERFADFLVSERSISTFEEYGFTRPESAPLEAPREGQER